MVRNNTADEATERPEERHENFVRENGEWNRKLEEALEEVDRAAEELAREAGGGESSDEK